MRPDMAKKLVERGSRGGGYAHRRRRAPVDLEKLDLSVVAGRLAEPERGDKGFDEYLAPLRRFVEGQEGRPWNKVFSEMREHIKPGNTVQEHILTHVNDYITLKARRAPVTPENVCGLVDVNAPRFSHRQGVLPEGRLYVDPDDGLIKRARRKLKGERLVAAEDGATMRHVGWNREAVAHGGVWYGVRLVGFGVATDASGAPSGFRFRDGQLGSWTDPIEGLVLPTSKAKLARMAGRYGAGNFATDFRPLTPRELKRHGLRNLKAR